MAWAEDYDLWLRLSAAGWGLAKVPATLLAWRHTAERHSLVSPKYRHESFLSARAYFLARHPMLNEGIVAIWGAGRTAKATRGCTARRARSAYDVDPARSASQCRGRACTLTDLVVERGPGGGAVGPRGSAHPIRRAARLSRGQDSLAA
jgi:hypothetical protein